MKMSEYVVRDASGAVDVSATCDKFGAELEAFIQTAERESVEIGAAVNAVFDQHKGACINMPALCSMTCGLLGVGPATYVETGEKVADYVRANKATFSITKGKGGGVRRLADCPPKE